jgi:alpha-galactosidase/6-phospho-beta-glucosidase family protein
VELDTLNLLNSMGQIPGLPSSVFVETPCEIRDGILHPRPVHLPPPALEACLRAAETTQAIVEAAQRRSLEGLRRCCEVDPTVRSPSKAFTALKECLRAHEDLLPVYS